MALSYPLSYEDFLGALPVEEVTFGLSQAQEHTRLADGSVISASLGAALWTGTMGLAAASHGNHRAVEALLALLDQPGASFLCHDPRYLGPASDPSGTVLGDRTVTVHSVNANMRELRLAGLPSAYGLAPGDMLAFAYGADPVRYALHRIVVGGSASDAGLSPSLEVVPVLRNGAASGLTVSLLRPACKARLLPNPAYGSGRQALTRGASFGFIQTLR